MMFQTSIRTFFYWQWLKKKKLLTEVLFSCFTSSPKKVQTLQNPRITAQRILNQLNSFNHFELVFLLDPLTILNQTLIIFWRDLNSVSKLTFLKVFQSFQWFCFACCGIIRMCSNFPDINFWLGFNILFL